MAPMGSPVSFSTMAHVVSLWNTVRIMCKLSSAERWGGYPALGPTSGSEAKRKSTSASSSRHARKISLVVSILSIVFNQASQRSYIHLYVF